MKENTSQNYCPDCGSELKAGKDFCSECGKERKSLIGIRKPNKEETESKFMSHPVMKIITRIVSGIGLTIFVLIFVGTIKMFIEGETTSIPILIFTLLFFAFMIHITLRGLGLLKGISWFRKP